MIYLYYKNLYVYGNNFYTNPDVFAGVYVVIKPITPIFNYVKFYAISGDDGIGNENIRVNY